MKKNISLVFLLFCLLPTLSPAYIPPGRFVLEQTAKKIPADPIHFEAEITLTHGVDQFKLKEQWYMNSDNTFHIQVQGLGVLKNFIKSDYIYSGGRRQYSLNSQKLHQAASSEIPEVFLKMNSFDRLTKTFEKMRILPSGVINKKIFSVKNNEYSYEVESYLRLSRAEGVICYLLKINPYSQQEEPALWIEQDRFAIRKIRFPSGAVAEYESYFDYEKNFQLPKKITLTWGAHKAEIKITMLGKKAPIKNPDFLISNLEDSRNLATSSDLPGANIINEFYSRFR